MDMRIQFSVTINNGFLHISDHELQVDVTGCREDGYTVEDQHTGAVLARNVPLNVAYHTATQYRQVYR